MEEETKGLPFINRYEHGDFISSLSVNGKWSVSFLERLLFLGSLDLFFLRNRVCNIKCAYVHNTRVIADWLLGNQFSVD